MGIIIDLINGRTKIINFIHARSAFLGLILAPIIISMVRTECQKTYEMTSMNNKRASVLR
jgi:hypothetical protein